MVNDRDLSGIATPQHQIHHASEPVAAHIEFITVLDGQNIQVGAEPIKMDEVSQTGIVIPLAKAARERWECDSDLLIKSLGEGIG